MRGSECPSGLACSFSGLGDTIFLHEPHTGSNLRMARQFEWRNLVVEGKNGFAFDRGSVKSLAKLMLNICGLSKRRPDYMREESRRIIEGVTPAHFAIGTESSIDAAKAAPMRRTSLL